MEQQGIYSITNTVSGKRYIGSTIMLNQRIITHRRKLQTNKHGNGRLQAAWNKHGEAAFVFEVLEYVTDQHLLFAREQDWIDKLTPKYNIKLVATGRGSGWHHTEATRQICSDLAKYRRHTEEHKARMSTLMKEMNACLRKTETRLCSKCGAEITRKPGVFRKRSKKSDNSFCSRKCSANFNRPLVDVACVCCKQIFLARPSDKRKFCSTQCYHANTSKH